MEAAEQTQRLSQTRAEKEVQNSKICKRLDVEESAETVKAKKEEGQHASNGFLGIVVEANVAEQHKRTSNGFPHTFVATEEIISSGIFNQRDKNDRKQSVTHKP